MNKLLLANKGTLRTAETEALYEEAKASGHLSGECVLCAIETKATFTHWKIVPNAFPYDKIASLHDMLIPLRHTDGEDFTREEMAELLKLRKTYLDENYQYVFEAMPNSKTVPAHFHLHLIITK